jgi:hypothetical protein
MKKYLPFVATLLLVFAGTAFGQTATPAPSPSPKPKPAMTKAQIQRSLVATERKLWEAWKNKDVKPFKATLSADSIMVGESGVADKTAAIKELTAAPCEVKSYTLSDFKVSMAAPNVALLTYKGVTDGTCGGTAIPSAWATSVYVNRGGKWLAYSHQETPTK